MIKLSKDTQRELISLLEKGIGLEGNILKSIDPSSNADFQKYIEKCKKADAEMRRKRLDITKTVQAQNRDLVKWKADNEKLNKELKEALFHAEEAKDQALNEVEVMQKKAQYELVGQIVKASLWIICGVGLSTTFLFAISLILGIENQIVQSSWPNIIGIILTNSFSIVGTIMGVKYATDSTKSDKK